MSKIHAEDQPRAQKRPILLGLALSTFAGDDRIVRLKVVASVELIGVMFWLLIRVLQAVHLASLAVVLLIIFIVIVLLRILTQDLLAVAG